MAPVLSTDRLLLRAVEPQDFRSEDAEGRGLAFEAMSRLRAWADTTLRWTTAVSYIHPETDRSMRLAERLGARPDPRAPRTDAESFVWRHAFPEAPA